MCMFVCVCVYTFLSLWQHETHDTALPCSWIVLSRRDANLPQCTGQSYFAVRLVNTVQSGGNYSYLSNADPLMEGLSAARSEGRGRRALSSLEWDETWPPDWSDGAKLKQSPLVHTSESHSNLYLFTCTFSMLLFTLCYMLIPAGVIDIHLLKCIRNNRCSQISDLTEFVIE